MSSRIARDEVVIWAFPRGEMVEEFEAVVFELRPGQVSGIFRSPFGFHIAKLYERKASGTRPLNEVRQETERVLYSQRCQQSIERFADQIRARAEIRKVRNKNS